MTRDVLACGKSNWNVIVTVVKQPLWVAGAGGSGGVWVRYGRQLLRTAIMGSLQLQCLAPVPLSSLHHQLRLLPACLTSRVLSYL